MNPVLKKIKLTEQNPVLILNAPEEYKEVISDIKKEIHPEIKGKYEFIQLFVETLKELEEYARKLTEILDGDGYLWICYPKGTSKKYKSDIKRNKILEVFAPFDFEGVMQVSIDEDWSALRVRHVDNIGTMKRKTAYSNKGKERIKNN